jgi:nitrogen regulatory protein PII|tara:strand:+ start:55 stop:357 length:303 start_codon:yes stop_codon:yes gene_type:complete
MKLYPVKLLTITCEILAQKNIMEILTKHAITGYTIYEVNGNGARGLRGQGFKNEKNVKIEIILREEKLQDIVEEVSRTMFANFAIVLYVSDVGVLRTEKF